MSERRTSPAEHHVPKRLRCPFSDQLQYLRGPSLIFGRRKTIQEPCIRFEVQSLRRSETSPVQESGTRPPRKDSRCHPPTWRGHWSINAETKSSAAPSWISISFADSGPMGNFHKTPNTIERLQGHFTKAIDGLQHGQPRPKSQFRHHGDGILEQVVHPTRFVEDRAISCRASPPPRYPSSCWSLRHRPYIHAADTVSSGVK